jgi:hypothetical protein
MSGMHFWDAHWDMREAECPCDVHLTDYLLEKNIRNTTLFHFGTGAHHHLGHAIHAAKSNIAVMGITASPSEYEAYVKLSIEQPEIAQFYKVFFGDIYQMEPRLLPRFDLVTLFHACEFRTEKNDSYGALTDATLIDLFMRTLTPQGRLAFYTGSFAWAKAQEIADTLCAQGRLVQTDTYKTLVFYAVPAAA